MHWDLTLYLGQELSTEEENLLSLDNLLQLSRLPWFVDGQIPEAARLELVDYLAQAGKEADIRESIHQALLIISLVIFLLCSPC